MNAITRHVGERRIEELEARMLSMPQAPCDVRHIFGPGLYIRELTMRAGTFAIGHRQKRDHINVLVQGSVIVMNDDGSTTELCAPLTFLGKPGRKVGYVTSDMIWLNVYATAETDVEKLEDTFLDKSEAFINHASLLPLVKQDDDFEQMLLELGVDAETVCEQSANESDQIPFPVGVYKVKVGKSRIHGKGLIAVSDLEPGELIAPMRIGGKRTPAGRFTNHSHSPNAKPIEISKGDIGLIALRPISGSHGGLDGDEITIDYRDSFALTKRISI